MKEKYKDYLITRRKLLVKRSSLLVERMKINMLLRSIERDLFNADKILIDKEAEEELAKI